jgi:photosystem II stability/assembly factor-like uncharacterized protein
MRHVLRLVVVLAIVVLAVSLSSLTASQFDPALLKEMRWRMIGPHRGGRTVAAVGIPSQPNVFYIGVNNGGVWKTNDYGRTWVPIFDDQPTGSIGAIAVAPSDPNVIYVGSGEGLHRPDLSTGDGIYKSTDAGRTWTHLGLRDGQQIPQIVVHPNDPNRLLVAVLGHPYGPNEERGIFRSTDGGRTFDKVLYKDENVGGIEVALDPSNPDIVYAGLWEARQAPWENGVFTGPGSGLYKSTDGGTTWRQLSKGLPAPEEGLGRIGLGMCESDSRRIYAIIASPDRLGGLYRSDDAGESWERINTDRRVWSREGDFHEVKAHPTNCDIVYAGNVAAWKSTDGGRTFTGWRGAPGGDDYHRIWINPLQPDIILTGTDQGAIITVNGGETWSSWYNQPTAQFYHVTTDNSFPYRVCGGQQESGSACVDSRGGHGQITFRDWHPVGLSEYDYAAPDPLDPDIVYGGKVRRFDRRTGQVQNIAPVPLSQPGYRVLRTQPIVFSPVDNKTLYFASNVLWKTTDGGHSWTQISPDLTRETWQIPASVGKYADSAAGQATRRGVIYTIAPSPLDAGRIWVGTDDGLIHVTADGGRTWTNVTPPQLEPWAKVSLMDASRFDPLVAYAAINAFRLDDLRPHIYRTRDGGRSWARIVNNIPEAGAVNVVREDHHRKGLLFAGTEREVYASFDDGERWQSLRLNMPATSIRDLVIKDDDLVVGTHGRSFWILDDITPLRQIDGAIVGSDAHLFRPAQAWRVRWNMNVDTPLPPEEPAGENPPDGAIIHYWLKGDASDGATLEILDGQGRLVRRFSSNVPPDFSPESEAGRVNFPSWWIRPAQQLRAVRGLHRFVWDVRYDPPKVFSFSYPISAIKGNTPRMPAGPWVAPGDYTARLLVGGRRYEETLRVKMDPRVRTSPEDLAEQFTVSMELYEAIGRAYDTVQALRSAKSPGAAAAVGGEQNTAKLEEELIRLHGQMLSIYNILQAADAKPTTQAMAAAADLRRQLTRLLDRRSVAGDRW